MVSKWFIKWFCLTFRRPKTYHVDNNRLRYLLSHCVVFRSKTKTKWTFLCLCWGGVKQEANEAMVYPVFRKHCTSCGFYCKWHSKVQVGITVAVFLPAMFILHESNKNNDSLIRTKVLYFALLNNKKCIPLSLSEGGSYLRIELQDHNPEHNYYSLLHLRENLKFQIIILKETKVFWEQKMTSERNNVTQLLITSTKIHVAFL